MSDSSTDVVEVAGRTEPVDTLPPSLEVSDPAIDTQWANEVELRIDAYDRGEIESLPIDEVMARYRSGLVRCE